MDAPVLYIVKFWIHPEGGQRVLDWLDGGHIAEAVELPGFLWSRRCKLEETDDQGWPAYVMIYGLESRAALEAYFQNPIRDKFAKEAEPFAHLMRAERSWGEVDFTVDA